MGDNGMFVGEYRHGIDDKGRIILPKKFRDDFAGGFFMTKGLERCLWLIPRQNWAALLDKLSKQDTNQAGPRAFVRTFFSGTHELTPDRQGRLVVPPPLRDYAELDKDVVLTGYNDRVELWDAAKWESYLAKAEAEYDTNAGLLDGGVGL